MEKERGPDSQTKGSYPLLILPNRQSVFCDHIVTIILKKVVKNDKPA